MQKKEFERDESSRESVSNVCTCLRFDRGAPESMLISLDESEIKRRKVNWRSWC